MGIAVVGSDIFVVNYANGTVGEYDTSGNAVKASLISGLPTNYIYGIAALGSDLFIVDNKDGKIVEYDTSGNLVNSSLITGLDNPIGIAIDTPEPGTFALFGLGLAGLGFRSGCGVDSLS